MSVCQTSVPHDCSALLTLPSPPHPPPPSSLVVVVSSPSAQLLTSTPSALLAACAGVVAQLGFAALWLLAAAYVASSAELQINEHGFGAVDRTSSFQRGLLAVHTLGGVVSSLFLQHLSHIAVAGQLARAYWAAAEAKLERPSAHTPLRALASPLLHVGSAAFGAVACSLLEPLAFVGRPCGLTLFDRFGKGGYVSVALFGTSLTDGGAWNAELTSRLAPRLLSLQSRLGLFLLVSKLAWAVAGAAVAGCLLVNYETLQPRATPDAGVGGTNGGVQSVYLPILVVFILTYVAAIVGSSGWRLRHIREYASYNDPRRHPYVAAIQPQYDPALLLPPPSSLSPCTLFDSLLTSSSPSPSLSPPLPLAGTSSSPPSSRR